MKTKLADFSRSPEEEKKEDRKVKAKVMLQKSPIGGTASTRRRRWQIEWLNPRSRLVGIPDVGNLRIPKTELNFYKLG